LRRFNSPTFSVHYEAIISSSSFDASMAGLSSTVHKKALCSDGNRRLAWHTMTGLLAEQHAMYGG
jgi:hypothetical protein